MKKYMKHILFAGFIVILSVALVYYGVTMWEIISKDIFPE